MQNILNRILANRDLDVSIVNFGDKVSCSEASGRHTSGAEAQLLTLPSTPGHPRRAGRLMASR